MNKQEAFVTIVFLQIISILIIFFASGEFVFIIFLIMFFTFDVCALILDFIDARNRQIIKEIHEREIEMIKLLKTVTNKTDSQPMKEEIEEGYVQIVNRQLPQLEVKPVEGDYRIIKK